MRIPRLLIAVVPSLLCHCGSEGSIHDDAVLVSSLGEDPGAVEEGKDPTTSDVFGRIEVIDKGDDPYTAGCVCAYAEESCNTPVAPISDVGPTRDLCTGGPILWEVMVPHQQCVDNWVYYNSGGEYDCKELLGPAAVCENVPVDCCGTKGFLSGRCVVPVEVHL
jgi:hypothetical protein